MSTAVNTDPASAAGKGEAQTLPPSPEVADNPIVAVPPAPTPIVTPPPASEPANKKPAEKPADVTGDIAKQLLSGEFDTDAAPKEKPAGTTEAAPAPAAPDLNIELPDVPHPMDDEDDPRDSDIDGRASEKTRTAFDRLRGRLRSAREEGQFGSMIINVAQTNGLDPDTVGSLITLAARAKTGDAKAAEQLQGVLGKLGIKPAPVAAPAVDAETMLLVEAQKVYQKLFADDVESADIAESTARAKAKLIAEENLKLRALSQPVTAETSSRQPERQPERQAQPTGLNPMESAANDRVNALVSKYAEAYTAKGADFKPVLEAARALIVAKAKAEGPINPLYWDYEFAQAVRKVQAQNVVKQTKPQTRTDGLRPSSESAGGGKPAGDFRADIVGKMLSGNI
jgi:hypothetical protein